ncbi:hypothetical protein [Vallitalea okinawensis]|nr:hypothetical protein [Vallitalea okinawensis]
MDKYFNRIGSVRPIEWYTGFMDYYASREDMGHTMKRRLMLF